MSGSDNEPEPASVFSTGERRIAELLREGHSIEAIAERRDEPVEAIERGIDRIRQKTDRAIATLIQSPYLEAAAADRAPEERERIRAAFERG